ncbi:MAG: enoyl-CoA hydratase [Candidatus Phaeomarinobacter sp.]
MANKFEETNGDLEDLTLETRGNVAVITLNRPDKLNAWTAAMESSMRSALAACAKDDAIRAIVVTGAGRGFCAGADMNLLQSIDPDAGEERELAKTNAGATYDWDRSLGPDISAHMTGRFGYMPQIPKPIIAAVNGPCAGLGMVFALWCDMRIGAEDMFFTTSFAKRGLIAEHGISWLLPELTGHATAMDLLLSARRVGAEEAKSVGLLNKMVPTQELVNEAVNYAQEMAETVSPRSVAVMKAQVWKSRFQSLSEAIEIGDSEMQKSFASEDFKEGVEHFVQKRAPRFTGL